MAVRRILTRKSLMKFGQHADMTVQQLIDIHEEQYLIWIYYNMSNISFMDDILDYLCCNKIEFPGTDPEKTHFAQWKYNEMQLSKVKGMDFLKFNSAKDKKRRRRFDYALKSKIAVININAAAKQHGQTQRHPYAGTTKGGLL